MKAVAVAATGLVLASCVARESPSAQSPTEEFSAPETTRETSTDASESSETDAPSGKCEFSRGGSGESTVGLPPEDGGDTGTMFQLTTSAGEMTVSLDASRAPCTVRSMAFLANEGFFDNTVCHRMTSSPGLKVLQCGDPKGTGGGGPGYTFPDELPTDLAPAADGQSVTYTRGLAAMANSGPDTNGSQFFLVYADSTLPPNYTVFGSLDEASLTVLDQIAAGGITPGPNGPEDGTPKVPVTIQKAAVA